jgi:uncharacterized heparinase superfamily protein
MSFPDRVLLYLRSTYHLRFKQIAYRPLRRLQRHSLAPAPPPFDVSPSRNRLALELQKLSEGGAGELDRADAIVRGRFRFLGHEERLESVDWQRVYVSHLWSYNLHYFDYALDLTAAYQESGDRHYLRGLEALVAGWIEGTEPGQGIGWEPYALSLRTVNWIRTLLLLGDAVDDTLRSRMEESLAQQLSFLFRRLEYHILANHYQKNLKALLFGGLYFAGREADRWLQIGERGLWRELFEQVLKDGGHYERSPMYHAIALCDYLEVIALLRAAGHPVPDEALERVQAMTDAFGVLCRPDGSVHLFNDAAQDIAPSRMQLDRLADEVLCAGIPVSAGLLSLPETGYYGWADRIRGIRVLFDAGEPGPSYQPGHAHCDLLSFEFDVEDRPLIVDSGVHGYEGDPLRDYVRSTRAHNTVSIGGKEQSEIWATFRMARRAELLRGGASVSGDVICMEGAYRPYHDRCAAHSRRIEGREKSWRIADRVEGATAERLESFLHLHPEWTVVQRDEGVLVQMGDVRVRITPYGIDRVRIQIGSRDPVQGWYCPEFGKAVPAPALEMTVERNDGREFGYTIEVEDVDG